MKPALVLALALIAGASVLSACGGSQDQATTDSTASALGKPGASVARTRGSRPPAAPGSTQPKRRYKASPECDAMRKYRASLAKVRTAKAEDKAARFQKATDEANAVKRALPTLGQDVDAVLAGTRRTVVEGATLSTVEKAGFEKANAAIYYWYTATCFA